MSTTREDGRVILTFKEAVARLPKGSRIHTFLNPGMNVLVGADWTRKEVLAAFKKYEVSESGPLAARMKHGLVFHDGKKHVFVQTIAGAEDGG